MISRRRISTRIIRIAAIILIETLAVRDGYLPRRAMAMVLEWAATHRKELQADWTLAAEHRPLNKIEPLE